MGIFRVIFKGHLPISRASEFERFVDYVLKVRRVDFLKVVAPEWSERLSCVTTIISSNKNLSASCVEVQKKDTKLRRAADEFYPLALDTP
jgi:hypothetical protein